MSPSTAMIRGCEARTGVRPVDTTSGVPDQPTTGLEQPLLEARPGPVLDGRG